VSRSSSDARLGKKERVDRTRARSWATQVLYRWETDGADRPLLDVFEETLRVRRMASRRIPLVEGHLRRLSRHLEEVDQALNRSLDNWRLDRLSMVDRSILRLAASEILFDPQVPPRVALQEGIRLAGQYGGSESSRFVNGVLDAILREHEGRDGSQGNPSSTTRSP